MNSLIARYQPRTLWLQTLLLLIVSVTIATIVTGPILLSRFESVAASEMEKKGQSAGPDAGQGLRAAAGRLGT
jgi:hypothetical protein